MKITDIITEAANPAQQAAIAVSMKKAGKKPKSEGMAEGAEPDNVFEADDWEEVGDKWKRFQKWAIDQIMRSTEKVETGNYVSKLENQYFGHENLQFSNNK
jgi:hypothetical protein